MYGSYSSSQYPSGPQQPEWRLPANAPAKHRPAASATPAASSLPPPPPPAPPPRTSGAASSTYNPSSYGPISGTASASVPGFGAVDTSSWGVRYNQQQYNTSQTPPPLPPRPPSTFDQSQTHVQTPVPSSPGFSQSLPAAPPNRAHTYPYQQWADPQYASQQTVGAVPPPPPPVPPVYQYELQQQQQQQSSLAWQQQQQQQQQPPLPLYSNLPPTHRYDPEVQQQHAQPSQSGYPDQTNTNTINYYDPNTGIPHGYGEQGSSPPVMGQSPPPTQNFGAIASTTASDYSSVSGPPLPAKASYDMTPASASALGPGGPSDWEHFSPAFGHIDSTGALQQRIETPVQSPPTSWMSSGPPTATSTPASSNPAAVSMIPPPPVIGNVSPATQSQHAGSHQRLHESYAASPVDPSITQETSKPPLQTRVDSLQSHSSSVSSIGLSEVMEAWTQPISPIAQPSTLDIRRSSVSTLAQTAPVKPVFHIETSKEEKNERQSCSAGTQTIEDANKEEVVVQTQIVDPYEDFDPWFKSSLERFVVMLRKEAVADADEDRYKIFTSFVTKEIKLREVLYNIEHEPKGDDNSARQSTPAMRQTTPNPVDTTTPPVESGLIPVESEISSEATSPAAVAADLESERYSPGGRPIISKTPTPAPRPSPSMTTPSSGTLPKQQLSPLTTNPPQPIYIPFRYTEGPQRGSDNLTFDRPAAQAYSALRQACTESGRMMSNAPPPVPTPRPDSASPAPVKNKPDETFIGLIREKSVAYRKGRPLDSSTPPPLPGLPVPIKKSKADRIIEELRSLALKPAAEQSETLRNIGKELEQCTADFRYIQMASDSWEKAAKERRQRLETERVKRQEESEQHIDDLFNAKEIGYADINTLEEEFRQTEARAQLQEERHELEDFIANVFQPLDARLKEEISRLRIHYDTLLGKLNFVKGDNNKDSSVADKYPLSETMKMIMDIYPKLETRYQKRLDIALDRERRRKKAERRPHVFIGDSPALKRLDADFDLMERRNIFQAAKDRDDRANRLMDAFDDAIMRGLGENQSLLDEVSTKVKRLETESVDTSGLPNAEVKQILKSVSNFVESLRADSESMLRSFGLADAALNDADYSVAVAEARYTNSDDEVFRRLENEKKKEDAKIRRDLDSKLKSVQKAPAEIIGKVNELLGKGSGGIKVSSSETVSENIAPSYPTSDPLPRPNTTTNAPLGADSASGVSCPIDKPLPTPPRPRTASNTVTTSSSAARRAEEDPEHQERLRKALEDAKRRNAARNNS